MRLPTGRRFFIGIFAICILVNTLVYWKYLLILPMALKRNFGIAFVLIPLVLLFVGMFSFLFALLTMSSVDVPPAIFQPAILLLPISAILALIFVPWGTVWMYKNTQAFSMGELLRKAHQLLVGRVWFWLGLLLLPIIISLGFGFIGGLIASKSTAMYNVLQIASFVVTMVLSFVLTRITVLAARGNTVTLEQGWIGFVPVLKYVAVNLLVGILTVIGMLAFIIPGIYVSLRFMFAPYVLAEKNVSIGEAMAESSRMTHGTKLDLFAFGLIMTVFVLIALIPLYLGLIYFIPLATLASALLYVKLANRTV